jgi:hypothetical protein
MLHGRIGGSRGQRGRKEREDYLRYSLRAWLIIAGEISGNECALNPTWG